MLDIKNKEGKTVAVIMDDGTVIKKANSGDDIDALVRAQLDKPKRK